MSLTGRLPTIEPDCEHDWQFYGRGHRISENFDDRLVDTTLYMCTKCEGMMGVNSEGVYYAFQPAEETSECDDCGTHYTGDKCDVCDRMNNP